MTLKSKTKLAPLGYPYKAENLFKSLHFCHKG